MIREAGHLAFVEQLAKDIGLGAEQLVTEHDHQFTIMFLAGYPDGTNDWALQVNVSRIDVMRALADEDGGQLREGVKRACIAAWVKRACIAAWDHRRLECENWRTKKYGA